MRNSCTVVLLFGSVLSAASVPSTITFTKDVAPILQNNCQGCHRPGEPTPMSLLTYKEVRPYAAAISEAVSLKKMPPWFADPKFGHFSNDRTLKQQDIDTLVAWAKTGAKEGNPKDLPKPAEFLEGWNIGKPDLTVEMAHEFKVPASGTIDYQYILVSGNFKEDTWVRQTEVRPGNRQLVHHVIAFVRPPGSKFMEGATPGIPYIEKDLKGGANSSEFLVGYAPGMISTRLEPGRAKLIQAGSDIVLQMHYTANGKEGADRTKVGFVFAKEPVKERVVSLAATTSKFEIPPNDPNYKVQAAFEFGSDAKVSAYLPHMHLRGKDFEYTAVYPTGEREVLLKVPHYSFDWQLTYLPVKDLVVPKGTRIECVAHYDNSVNNPANPDATKAVRFGEQSWEEMMFGFFDVVIDAKASPSSIYPPRKKKPAAPAVLE